MVNDKIIKDSETGIEFTIEDLSDLVGKEVKMLVNGEWKKVKFRNKKADVEAPIEVIKPLLNVYARPHPKTGKLIINWDYGEKVNAYFLIGVLHDIQDDLICFINEESADSEENDGDNGE